MLKMFHNFGVRWASICGSPDSDCPLDYAKFMSKGKCDYWGWKACMANWKNKDLEEGCIQPGSL